jgi:hypothetical protein
MWLWDINNINFIVGYKKYHSCSNKDFFINLPMDPLIHQKTQKSNRQEKVNAHQNKKEG